MIPLLNWLSVESSRSDLLVRPISRRVFAGLSLLALCGCSRGPVAPELRDSPVYRNRLEGFRFLVPDGWSQTASSNLPPGDLETELFLVRYSVRSPEPNAQVQVLCFQDKGSDASVAEHHSRPAFGVSEWKLEGESRTEIIGRQEGTWLYYTGPSGKAVMAKEVLCFRKRDRVYSFVGTFWQTDEKARQAIQRAFKSVVWD